MKIYIAARYSRFPEMQTYRDTLCAKGHIVTSRWIEGSHKLDDGISTQGTIEQRMRFALDDYEDLQNADCIVNFTEDPNARLGRRGGRHVEFGLAVAWKKRLIVVGHRENVFHWLPGVEFFETWEAALAVI